jgi:hypothetical protein
MEKISTFEELCANPYFNTQMKNLYGDVNDIDPWVGFLSEDHMSNSLFGETVMSIMTAQFRNLRDGDRFYYLNDAELKSEDIDFIESSTLAAVIKRNTGVKHISDHVFTAHPMIVNTENVAFLNEITISPNPNDGNFDIQIPEGIEIEKYYVLNNTGNKIIEKHIQDYSSIQNINIEAASGLYHLVIITAEGMTSKRIILN